MPDTTAQENWDRYEYGRQRGHIEYCTQARRCEDFYLGGGLQWSEDDIAALGDRPAYELNHIMPTVNTAIGHQIQNRLDLAYQPRGGFADQDKAEIMTKVALSIIQRQNYHFKETCVFGDGMIQQRGYFDIRMDYQNNVFGDACIDVLDTMDVIPDPDAKTYVPKGWADVIVARWLTLDEIEDMYGVEARRAAEAAGDEDGDFGEETADEERNKFGTIRGAVWKASFGDSTVRRLRIIDRQRWKNTKALCAIWPTGEIRVAEGLSEPRIAAMKEAGCYFIKRRVRRVQWVVSTRSVTLFDKWSPYDRFTVVPFFAYFRRGRTRGMVDNAISPQEMVNKEASQFIHILNTTANSGYTVEENSLSNMTTDDLREQGANTGIVIEHKQGTQPPKKIEPNQVPQGVDRAIERGVMSIKEITGISDAMQGLNGPEVSGIAIQSKQFMGQQQLAVPRENLSATRKMVAEHLMYLIQNFYDSYRVFKLTEQDPITGADVTNEYEINVAQLRDDGTLTYLNDVTTGEYDCVVSEQPTAVTFENGQFQQALELRKSNVAVPDHVVIKHSNLSEKQEIIKTMQEQQGRANPLDEAQVRLIDAQTRKTSVESVNKAVEALFSATQAANQIALMPQIAPMADQMLKSAGFEDQDAAPIVPEAAPGAQGVPLPANTNPITPTNPAVGMTAGIEGGA
jgi:hypothetical protein